MVSMIIVAHPRKMSRRAISAEEVKEALSHFHSLSWKGEPLVKTSVTEESDPDNTIVVKVYSDGSDDSHDFHAVYHVCELIAKHRKTMMRRQRIRVLDLRVANCLDVN